MKINYQKAIVSLRAKMNISQEELAQILGVAFSSVNRWENGHHDPTKIAKYKLDELFKQYGIDLKEVEE